MFFKCNFIFLLKFCFLIIESNVSCQQSGKDSKKSSSNSVNSQVRLYSTAFPDKALNPVASHPLNYCSFFNNRAPSPQINLKNCTWYKENSCCLQSEIESTFSKVKPLIGSSEICQKYLNNLMCYICAPNQFKFYGKERLTVCTQFCDKMYDACAEAILKGSKINEIYSNGEEFCKSRRYNTGDIKQDNCFDYKIEHKTNSSNCLLDSKKNMILIVLILFVKNHRK